MRKSEEQPVIIALGSNLGDSSEIIRSAMNRLQGLSVRTILRSSLWRSSPVDCPPGSPDFVNAVILLIPEPAETPESLLGKLQRMEAEFGRQPKKELNEARPLDLDLISFRAETRNARELTLPHPRAHVRRFVLEPLAEVAPTLILPGQSETVAHLLRNLTPVEPLERLG